MRNDVIQLYTMTYEKNDHGVMEGTETLSDPIMAEIKSAGASEWFEGGRNGLNPSMTFTIRRIEYNGQETVLYDSTKYTVYRTYIRGDLIELHCEKRKGA